MPYLTLYVFLVSLMLAVLRALRSAVLLLCCGTRREWDERSKIQSPHWRALPGSEAEHDHRIS